MVRQKPWDQYEAAILLDAVVKVHAGEIDRKKAVSDVSRQLRQKAKKAGLEIDEIYRNIAGITFQMYSMESAYVGHTLRKPATKLFSEIVSMMKENKEEYEAILQEARSLIANEQRKTDGKSITHEADSESVNVAKYKEEGGIKSTGFGAEGFASVNNATLTYKDNDVYRSLEETIKYLKTRYSVRLHYNHFENPTRYSYDLLYKVRNGKKDIMWVYYIQSTSTHYISIETEPKYLKGISEPIEGFYRIHIRSSYPRQKMFFVSFEEIAGSLKNICDSIDKYFGVQFSNIHSAKNVETYANEEAKQKSVISTRIDDIKNPEEKKSAFVEWMISNGIAATTARQYVSSLRSAMVIAKENNIHADDIFEINDPNELKEIFEKLSKLPEFIEKNSVRHNQLRVPFVKYIQFSGRFGICGTDFGSATRSKYVERQIDFDKNAFIRVLMERYQNGIQIDSIDLEIFRDTYNDIIGEELRLSDDDLGICLRRSGVVYKDRIFPAEGIIKATAKEKLMTYIRDNFDSGKRVLYYASIYSDLADDLAYCFNLTDAAMLRPYLQYVCEPGEYCFSDKYMSKEDDVKIDHSADVEKYLLSEGKPMSYDEVYEGLSHISKDILHYEIRTNPNFILNERAHYFHYGIFELSSDEADIITGFIDEELQDDGYCIWAHVYKKIKETMPLFLENNIYLSSLGIRNAVAKKLSGRFNFDGEVISRRGENLNMAAVYKLYAEHHAPFSDDDIYEFSKELNCGIYFDPLSEVVVRVSKELFVARREIAFNVEETDNALSSYLESGYMPISEIDSFLVFPNVGYEWNEFLLESYLMFFSDKYTLLNNGRSLNNVAGVMVKKGSKYIEFEDVCADILAKGDCQLTKDKALDYLVNINLLTRRSYRKIDSALAKARQIRTGRNN